MNIRAQVIQFHEAGGIPIAYVPHVPADDRVRLRLKLVLEEAFELMQACADDGESAAAVSSQKDIVLYLCSQIGIKVDIEKFIDACADIDYVVEGSRLEFGVEGEPVANEVHRVNMTKFPPGFVKREDGKVLKPEGFTPPNVRQCLIDQGWKS